MHAFAIDSEELFEFLKEYLLKSQRFQQLSTHVGHPVLASPPAPSENDDTHRRGIFILGPNKDSCRQNISWVYKNLHPQSFISLGFSDDCRNDETVPGANKFVPASCLRSAGHSEFGGNPVLFEEIFFDAELQKKISAALAVPTEGFLFGSDRKIVKEDEHKWLWSNLHCLSWDQFTADLLLAGKRFHCPVGCVKMFAPESTNQKKILIETFNTLATVL